MSDAAAAQRRAAGSRGTGRDVLRELGRKLAQGEAGALLVLLMVAAIWTFFQFQNDRFLSPGNLTNLMLQQAAVATISIGVVLILLLGEIDLSVGAVSGFCASVMAVLIVQPRRLAGARPCSPRSALGALIGLFNGFMITRFRIPSFVVTLAGLAHAGRPAALRARRDRDDQPDATTSSPSSPTRSSPPLVGWIVAVVGDRAHARVRASSDARGARRAGLQVGSMQGLIFRVGAIAAAIVVADLHRQPGPRAAARRRASSSGWRSVFAYLTERTRFGRHIFAVGGNAEAARRAGIKIDHVRIIVFVLGSTLAAAGGVLAASRLMAVNQSSGGSDLLLMAIAGPVIAGTSLFGGRGSVWSALLGARRHRLDRQRHEPARVLVVGEVHRHRRRPDRRGHDRGRHAHEPSARGLARRGVAATAHAHNRAAAPPGPGAAASRPRCSRVPAAGGVLRAAVGGAAARLLSRTPSSSTRRTCAALPRAHPQWAAADPATTTATSCSSSPSTLRPSRARRLFNAAVTARRAGRRSAACRRSSSATASSPAPRDVTEQLPDAGRAVPRRAAASAGRTSPGCPGSPRRRAPSSPRRPAAF